MAEWLKWFRRLVPVQPAGESCENCCHFIDYRDTEDDPDEVNGYCGQLVDALGFEKALAENPYGGHWTHHLSWCRDWQGGKPLWEKENLC